MGSRGGGNSGIWRSTTTSNSIPGTTQNVNLSPSTPTPVHAHTRTRTRAHRRAGPRFCGCAMIQKCTDSPFHLYAPDTHPLIQAPMELLRYLR
ncbi:hypothetical protein M404DRAFT_734920 [Pisolithus tinctorius Marx 270]|uniref:Uncharacterized protein n=1 Tax=Pisolithus tinctorius Marx 270 TaxID=870435 RepID=A0A0C3IXA6_PISTI|nr:hypothetical protein M404DRAFT_734920 [Pisolithus tinctorius Marx 270]